jgi:AcrR family transcriptional regulator
MPKGRATRERLLSIAERAVLAKGFTATSIDEIIAEAGITKSGFFYHFRDKNELALALIERYLVDDEAKLDALFARARTARRPVACVPDRAEALRGDDG